MMYLQDRYNYIISAEKSDLRRKENMKRTSQLDFLLNVYKALYTENTFDFHKTYGVYENKRESSFIVSAPYEIVENDTFDEMIRYVSFNLFNQESILIQNRQGKFTLHYSNGKRERSHSSKITDLAPLQGGYTYLPKQNKFIQLFF